MRPEIDGGCGRARLCPAGRARLGAAGRRYVQQNRRWDAVWDRYERALAELIAGRR